MLAQAARCGVIAPALAMRLTEIAKGLFYKERTGEAILAAAAKAGLPTRALRDLADWLPHGLVNLKNRDAAAMVARIRTHLAAGPPPLAITYRLAETAAWRAALRLAEVRDGEDAPNPG